MCGKSVFFSFNDTASTESYTYLHSLFLHDALPIALDNGDAVKLTTARYYTPSGKSIQARGIDPDVVLKPEGKEGEDSPADYAEVLLPGHLQIGRAHV